MQDYLPTSSIVWLFNKGKCERFQ